MISTAVEIPFWSEDEIAAAIRPALEQLELRRVLAYPTETVYGFGGGVDRDSVDALIKLKGRPKGNPFLLLIANSAMLAKLDLQERVLDKLWPARRIAGRARAGGGGLPVRAAPTTISRRRDEGRTVVLSRR